MNNQRVYVHSNAGVQFPLYI